VASKSQRRAPKSPREAEALIQEGQAQLKRILEEIDALLYGAPLVMTGESARRALAKGAACWQGLQELQRSGRQAQALARHITQAAEVRRRLMQKASKQITGSPKRLLPEEEHIIERASKALELLEALVPRRIANEEIGDAQEFIHRMASAHRPGWMIYLKVVTTYFWILTHAVAAAITRAADAVRSLGGSRRR
jgi:Fe2+ transport system protein B